MGEEGDIGDGSSPNSHELNEEPEAQDEEGGEADELNEDNNEKQGENPGTGKEEKVSAQYSGHSSASPDHGDGGVWVG